MKKLPITSAVSITFTFDGLAPVVFDASKAAAPMRHHAEMHGWQARIGDNAAIARKAADGSIINVTEQMRRDAVVELVEHYESASEQWAIRASASVKQNPHIAAIAAKRGCTYAEAEAWFNEKLMAELEAE